MVFWKKKAVPTTQSNKTATAADSGYGLKNFADPDDGEVESVMV